ncbi:tRNA dihydrouridine(20/20a) synthase DusA [Lichenihabitans sp. Uapishka_5]|uniref:tRNA dihydrouridine(20/20a) synthase DusA n=1 Tax=Lichenihabitans sp. Uapishka_5 TaxID=3037302 RepID=UPI0029E81F44|nr:tRNA dihydrouridine(20/20a) synthase DusA [Lichenihabitans sp. Uapishka_5]MDX7952313.1 tRNA dihydrouridine(20/20a) synthase DusA [Lichenihabitans sp. Uapishka_5]
MPVADPTMLTPADIRFSVAPMMDWTDRHCRVFHRILSRRARLYTEMVTAGAVIHGPRDRLLGFDAVEHPVAMQLGGSVPADLAAAARIAADYGYDEINLNCGCPSDRVKNGSFGACLMRDPALVAEGIAAMRAAVPLPVTVKCRIGVDDQDPEEALPAMADAVLAAGAAALIVHARKAWLQGLSPKQNRDVPPLDYSIVARLKAERPQALIGINGGLTTVAACAEQLTVLDGAMVGRAAYHDPEMLLGVDPTLFGEPAPVPDGFAAVEAFMPYMAGRLAAGVRLHDMTRHLLGLFPGLPGARLWRRHLATEAPKPGAGLEVVRDALAHVTRPAASLAA